MMHPFYNKQDIMTTSKLDAANLKAISRYKEQFVQNSQDPGSFGLLEPEVAASWKRSKQLKVDPEMQELSYILRPAELRALLNDKKAFVDLAKSYFYTFLPLLNMPKTSLCIQNENGTIMDLSDRDKLLRLKMTNGSIWREETVGTSSTSLCLEYGKIVQLAGARHYCNVLENQLATTTPINDDNGDKLGLITIVNDVTDISMSPENLGQILCWISVFRIMLETKLALLKSSYRLGSVAPAKDSALADPTTKKDISDSQEPLPADVHFSNILGESAAIQKVIQTAECFAQTDIAILLTGESGTGKEMFAQAIHKASERSGAFVAINCAALPPNLIASELFGYVNGAFTGAENKGRLGKIELVKDGTLFLDEIGDLPLEIQPMFLRVLEDKKVTRLGSNREIYVDFRLIAATNADLFQMVREKKFREDLYYRLESLNLELPALRERGRDILVLANYFLEEFCAKTAQRSLKLSKETEIFMLNYAWPGNVRQLKSAMVYAANICRNGIITLQDLPASIHRGLRISLDDDAFDHYPLLPLAEMEQRSIKKALALSRNNIRMAAEMLGLSKTSIYRKLKEYHINLDEL